MTHVKKERKHGNLRPSSLYCYSSLSSIAVVVVMNPYSRVAKSWESLSAQHKLLLLAKKGSVEEVAEVIFRNPGVVPCVGREAVAEAVYWGNLDVAVFLVVNTVAFSVLCDRRFIASLAEKIVCNERIDIFMQVFDLLLQSSEMRNIFFECALHEAANRSLSWFIREMAFSCIYEINAKNIRKLALASIHFSDIDVHDTVIRHLTGKRKNTSPFHPGPWFVLFDAYSLSQIVLVGAFPTSPSSTSANEKDCGGGDNDVDTPIGATALSAEEEGDASAVDRFMMEFLGWASVWNLVNLSEKNTRAELVRLGMLHALYRNKVKFFVFYARLIIMWKMAHCGNPVVRKVAASRHTKSISRWL